METNIILEGDCLIKLKELPDNSVDSIVTDPPYHLTSIVKRFGKEDSAPAQFGTDGAFARASKGFMGKTWDGGDIAQNVEMWKECLRVLKPGGHLLAFGGTRTYHRMACAIEDAGFEVRDMIEWVYGSGFPKSLNIGKAVDKLQGNEGEVVGKGEAGFLEKNDVFELDNKGYRSFDLTKGTSEYEGWGTALKPAHEPICMARKPLAEKTVAENCLKYGTGGINIDESRVGNDLIPAQKRGNAVNVSFQSGGFTEEHTGRFPANLIHDNSEEVRECFPESKGGGFPKQNINGSSIFGTNNIDKEERVNMNDSGNASRFFKSIIYQAKASKSERNKGCEGLDKEVKGMNFRGELAGNGEPINIGTNKNFHPTIKPIALMEYLIKMVTPKGGIVLDPFAGSGTTLICAKLEGYSFIGIEMEPEYIKIARDRLEAYNETS